MTGNPPTRPFLGWRMLALAVATAVMTGPGQTIGVSVFIDHLVSALDLSRSLVSTAYLVGTLTGAAAMPFVGRFVDRRGVRISQMVFGAAFVVALTVMSGVRGLPWLIVGFAGIRMFGQGSLSMISSVTVAVWFERRRGLAMGILATASGALMTLVPVVLNLVIEATSWRIAWLVAAASVAMVVLPGAWFGLIDRPESVGQRPDGDHRDAVMSDPDRDPDLAKSAALENPAAVDLIEPVRPATPTAVGYTRAQAVVTRQFLILALIGAVSGMLSTGLNFHQIDLLGEAGLSPGQAAAMFLPQIVGSSLAALGTGYLLDRVGSRFVPTLTMALLAVVHLLAANLDSGAGIVVYAVVLGSAGGSVRSALSTMIPGYFGTAHIGSIQGVLTVANVAGSALGPVALAVTRALVGSYRVANLLLGLLPLAALLITLFNRPLDPSAAGDSGTLEQCVAT